MCIGSQLALKMRDINAERPSGGQTVAVEIPYTHLKRAPRKRRNRPATERFHDLYDATGELLGQGSQGSVNCYKSRKTGTEFAVKVIDKSVDYDRRKILKEIDIFHHCQGHPNILQLNEYYEEDERFYLVFDRLEGGSLFEQIQRKGHFTEFEASKITKNLAEALAFLHNKGIAHRDLKPENILCETKTDVTAVRICDFDLGSAIVKQQETPVTTPELLTPVGSLEYMAPEVVDAWVGDAFSYNKKCDIWSMGIILYAMLCGYPPFYAKCGRDCGWERGDSCAVCQEALFEKIQSGVYDFPEKDWASISDNAKDLIRHMLVRNPVERYTAEDILNHPWIKDPVPDTSLATPSVLLRNLSSQLLDTYAENAMAFNRMMFTQNNLRASCSTDSSSSGASDPRSNPFFSAVSANRSPPDFIIGSFSDDDLDDLEFEPSSQAKDSFSKSLKLSLPTSKLAQRRHIRNI